MKALPIVIAGLCLSISLSAQFGVNGKYLLPGNNWQLTPASSGQEETSDLFDRGWSAGVDYWFRLKNKRVEFTPEINFAQLRSSLSAYSEDKAGIYSFFFNTNIYFLNFKGDCDCPVWSKEGPTLEKGLFLQVSPGLSYWDVSTGTETATFKDRQMAFSIGGGLGFDLGLSDLITLTPLVNVRYFSTVNLKSLEALAAMSENFVGRTSANPVFWSAGLRLGIRLDH